MAAGHASDSDSDAGGEGQYTQLLMGAFGTVDVYEILGVPRDADNKAITRAYRKRSLKYVSRRNCWRAPGGAHGGRPASRVTPPQCPAP